MTAGGRSHDHRDLTGRERFAMAPLVLLILVLGLFPKPMLDVIEPTIKATMDRHRGERPAAAGHRGGRTLDEHTACCRWISPRR